MSSDITLQKIREKKSLMEGEIFAALQKFNVATGLSVEEISISSVQRVGPVCQKLVVSVNCKIEIN